MPALPGVNTPGRKASICVLLDNLDLVTIGIFNEGNDCRTEFHGSSLTCHLAATGTDFLDCRRRIRDTNGEMTKTIAYLVRRCLIQLWVSSISASPWALSLKPR